MSKEEILLQRGYYLVKFLCFEYTFYRFFLEQGITRRQKILAQGEKILCREHIPEQI